MIRSTVSVGIVAAWLVAQACANPSPNAGWHGTITDSAGITIVTHDAAAPNIDRWVTEPSLTIGEFDGPDEYTFGRIADVDVDDDGNLFVLDQLARYGMVYGPDGQFRYRFVFLFYRDPRGHGPSSPGLYFDRHSRRFYDVFNL